MDSTPRQGIAAPPVSVQDWDVVGDAVSTLRVRVWKPLAAPGSPGLSLTKLSEALDVDPRTKHFVCGEPAAVVGALRLTADFLPESILTRVAGSTPDRSCLLSRLVVDAAHRNRGIAKRLELAAIEYATVRGQRVAWVEATPTTAEPLGRIGFEAVGSYHETTAIFVKQPITIMRRELGR